MASASHDILVLALREDPSQLGDLVERLHGRRIGTTLSAVDSSVRFANTSEVRPDIVLRGPKDRWVLVEVQQRIDRAKRRRWPLAAGILFDQHGTMGDVVVVTASPAVARWAGRAADVRGPLGTRFVLRPVVILIDPDNLDALLDEDRPTLALFAVWAVRGQAGPRARAVLTRALEVTEKLDEPLRANQQRAILDMIGEAMSAFLKKLAEHPEILPLSPGYRRYEAILMERGRAAGRAEGRAEGRSEGKAEGKADGNTEGRRDALLALCAARGLRLDAAQRRRVLACTNPLTLDRWIRRAAVVDSADRALAVARGSPSSRVARVKRGSRRQRTNGRRPAGGA